MGASSSSSPSSSPSSPSFSGNCSAIGNFHCALSVQCSAMDHHHHHHHHHHHDAVQWHHYHRHHHPITICQIVVGQSPNVFTTDPMFSQKFSPLSSLLEGGAATKKASKNGNRGPV